MKQVLTFNSIKDYRSKTICFNDCEKNWLSIPSRIIFEPEIKKFRWLLSQLSIPSRIIYRSHFKYNYYRWRTFNSIKDYLYNFYTHQLIGNYTSFNSIKDYPLNIIGPLYLFIILLSIPSRIISFSIDDHNNTFYLKSFNSIKDYRGRRVGV